MSFSIIRFRFININSAKLKPRIPGLLKCYYIIAQLLSKKTVYQF